MLALPVFYSEQLFLVRSLRVIAQINVKSI